MLSSKSFGRKEIMTMATNIENAPRIMIGRRGGRFALASERSPMVSLFLNGKSLAFAKGLITHLMGLCPVSHCEALEAACCGQLLRVSGCRVAIEAMLESVRVFAVDWQRHVSQVAINEASLVELGQLRQRLYAALLTRSDNDTEQLFVDTQRFVRQFQITYLPLFDALLKATEPLEVLASVPSKVLLTPAQFKTKATLEQLLSQLRVDSFFAVTPRLDGVRLVGAVARAYDNGTLNQPVTMQSFVVQRWLELSRWATMPMDAAGDFAPNVFQLDQDWKVAVVETVRGPLMQAVKHDGVILEDYHVIAPTEWAFQSEGILVEKLNEFISKTALEGQALQEALNLLASLFDACTDVQVQMGEMHA